MHRLRRSIPSIALLLITSTACLAMDQAPVAVTQPAPATSRSPTDLPKRMAGTTWGSYLNPGGDVPVGSFKVMYINTERPRQVIASEVVDDIAINYAYKDLHDIPSEDFGAYWVGRLNFPAPETRMINVSQSWSKARIIIDREIVYEGDDDARQSFDFSKGVHLVEVEYINNWHTTEFRVIFDKRREAFTRAQILEALSRRGVVNADVHYVGVNESKSKDLTIHLFVARNLKNVVLVLNSSSPVKWTINDPARSNVRAIIYSSYKPGNDVVGTGLEKILLLPFSGTIGSHDFAPRCHCTAGRYHCDSSSSLLSTKVAVEDLTRSRMVGFSGAYSASDFALPDIPVTDETLQKVKAQVEAEDHKREECIRESDPDFESMPQ